MRQLAQRVRFASAFLDSLGFDDFVRVFATGCRARSLTPRRVVSASVWHPASRANKPQGHVSRMLDIRGMSRILDTVSFNLDIVEGRSRAAIV